MNFFKRSAAAMSPLETALLTSLKTEPTKWFFFAVTTAGPSTLRCDNRDKGVSVCVEGPNYPSAFSGKLEFCAQFAAEWSAIAFCEHYKRVAESDRNESAKVETQMRQRMGL